MLGAHGLAGDGAIGLSSTECGAAVGLTAWGWVVVGRSNNVAAVSSAPLCGASSINSWCITDGRTLALAGWRVHPSQGVRSVMHVMVCCGAQPRESLKGREQQAVL